MSIHQLEQLSSGTYTTTIVSLPLIYHSLQPIPQRGNGNKLTIIRNRIRRRPQAVEAIPTLLIGLELPAEIKLLLLGILLLIQPIRASLPHLNSRPDERLLGRKVHDLPVHECHFAIGRRGQDDVRPVVPVGGVGAEEWAEDGGCGGGVGGFVGQCICDFVYEAIDYLLVCVCVWGFGGGGGGGVRHTIQVR